MKKLDFLLIETFAYCPHLETSGEIALTLNEKGFTVGIAFILVNNLDDFHPDHFRKFLGASRKNRVINLFKTLHRFGLSNTILYIPKEYQVHKILKSTKNQISRIDNIEHIKQIRYEGINFGISVASSYISRLGDPEPPIDNHIIEKYFYSSIQTYIGAKDIIEKYNPTKVITYNGRYACSKPIIDICHEKNIEILYHERGATQDKYQLTTYPPHNFRAIRVQISELWESSTNKNRELTAENYFIRKAQGEGINWLSFTTDQKPGMVPPKNKKYRWVYYSSSDDEYASLDDELKLDNPIFKSQFDAVEWLISFVSEIKDTELIIRVHPHKQKKSHRLRKYWEDLSGNNVVVIPSNSPIDSYALGKTSDIVITYSSTMGVEAAFLGKPVILLGDALYKGLNCVYEPQTIDELMDLLNTRILLPKPKSNAYPYGFYFYTFGTSYKFYEAESLFTGKFCGSYLTCYPKISYYFVKFVKQFIKNLRSLLLNVEEK